MPKPAEHLQQPGQGVGLYDRTQAARRRRAGPGAGEWIHLRLTMWKALAIEGGGGGGSEEKPVRRFTPWHAHASTPPSPSALAVAATDLGAGLAEG